MKRLIFLALVWCAVVDGLGAGWYVEVKNEGSRTENCWSEYSDNGGTSWNSFSPQVSLSVGSKTTVYYVSSGTRLIRPAWTTATEGQKGSGVTYNDGATHTLSAYPGGGGTTNTCTASITLTNTLAEIGHNYESQRWDIYWLWSGGSLLLKTLYVLPGGSQPLTVNWDYGTGKCPGQLLAVGERPGYDTPTNRTVNSSDGTRPIGNPPGDGATAGTPTGSDGNLADNPAATENTNSPTAGNLNALMQQIAQIAQSLGAEIRRKAEENTLRGQTNLLGQNLSALRSQLNESLLTTSNLLYGILTNSGPATNDFGEVVAAVNRMSTNLAAGFTNQLSTGFPTGGLATVWGSNSVLSSVVAGVPEIGSEPPVITLPLSKITEGSGLLQLDDVSLNLSDEKVSGYCAQIRAIILFLMSVSAVIMACKIAGRVVPA